MNPADAGWRPTATIEALRLRAALLARVRDHFATTRALEVETPTLVHAAVTDVHLESLEVRHADGTVAGHLHTSPEYAMKRLLCAGAPDVYQVTRVFRDGERGRNHNPEFTMVEWYRLGIDHHALMRDVEALVRTMLAGYRDVGPSQTCTYAEAFERALGVDVLRCRPGDLVAALARRGVDVPAVLGDDLDGLADLAMSTVVAPAFPPDRLTFIHDFPASQAALARVRGPVASRFEAFWGGIELANGFHELGDAAEQARRFRQDLATRRERGQRSHEPDERFLAALGAGLPECSGVALGFDRVVMVAARAGRIDDVVAFTAENA